MIKIGYQGVKGSYNYTAAEQFAKKEGYIDFKLVPLISSQNVVNALNAGSIQFGIIAFQNSIAGTVKESYDAIAVESFEHYDTIINQINHCVFAKKGVSPAEIQKIISHEMAIKQCHKYLDEKFPNAEISPADDTANAAKRLSISSKENFAAVICSKDAGVLYGLDLIDEGVQDRMDNYTEFRVYKQRQLKEQIPLRYKLLSVLYGDDKPELVVNLFIVLFIFSLLLIYKHWFQGKDEVGASTTIGSILSTVVILLTSHKLRLKYYHSFIKGFYIYQTVSDLEHLDPEQRYATPRVARIFETNGKLKIEIFIADRASRVFAHSTDVIHSDLSEISGKLTYMYAKGDITTGKIDFSGTVNMKWEKEVKWDKIMSLSARYYGDKTNDRGSVNYHRITKQEYHRIKNFDYVSVISA